MAGWACLKVNLLDGTPWKSLVAVRPGALKIHPGRRGFQKSRELLGLILILDLWYAEWAAVGFSEAERVG